VRVRFTTARPRVAQVPGTRRGIAEWLDEPTPTLVGIDDGFSFPLRYFEVHRLKPDWTAFLDDFQRHWPTDKDCTIRIAPSLCGSVCVFSPRASRAMERALIEHPLANLSAKR
jgi:hypothetical protein